MFTLRLETHELISRYIGMEKQGRVNELVITIVRECATYSSG